MKLKGKWNGNEMEMKLNKKNVFGNKVKVTWNCNGNEMEIKLKWNNNWNEMKMKLNKQVIGNKIKVTWNWNEN